ncbi:MAG: M56 family metallopeptidase, partial [Pseudomonadota bacterium]
LVLLLRKPVRALLGSIAGYRLWVLTLLWLPAFALGGKLVTWLQTLQPVNRLLPQPEIAGFELLLNDWVVEPLGNLGRSMSASSSISLDASEVAALLWLAGASAIIARQLHKYRRFSRYLREESRPAMRTDAPATKLQNIFGDTLPALVLPGINSAALFGIRKPVLLLPESFSESYDSDQQHIILAHEAVHLRRGDNAWNLAAGLVVALNWPNPLFWFAWRCFRLDQELSCDALALKSCTQTQQKRYARTLLDAASTAVGLGPQPMLSAWDNLNDLQERTLMITQHLKNKVSPFFTRCCMSLIATTGAVAMALLAGAFSPDAVAAESVDQRIRTVLEEALALMNDEKLAEARAKLEELEPETPYVRSRVEQLYASLEMKAEDYAAARAHLEAALASGGLTEAEISSTRYALAQSWIPEEKWAEGAAALEQWLETAENPGGGPYYLLAVAYYNLDQFDKAIPPAEQAVRVGGEKSQEAWRQMLSAVYLQTEQYEKALPVVREQVRLYPDKEIYQNQLRNLEGRLQNQ